MRESLKFTVLVLIFLFISFPSNLGDNSNILSRKVKIAPLESTYEGFNSSSLSVVASSHFMSDDSAFIIDGNSHFLDTALACGWPGDGSSANPILIKDLNFSSINPESFDAAITIRNTDLFFQIINCSVSCPETRGFVLTNVSNGNLTANTITHLSDIWDWPDIEEYGTGMVIINCTHISIIGNFISENTGEGIYCERSNHNDISKNHVSANGHNGLTLIESTTNTICDNQFRNNSGVGIELINSPFNIISDNEFIHNGIIPGVEPQTEVSNNTVNGKSLIYWQNMHDSIVPPAGQIILINCTSILIANQNLANVSFSIIVLSCKNTMIINNTLDISRINGIYIENSMNNTISNNSILKRDPPKYSWRPQLFDYPLYYHELIFVCILDSSNNNISYNKILSTYPLETEEGIWLLSLYLSNTANTILCENLIDQEIRIQNSPAIFFSRNTITGKLNIIDSSEPRLQDNWINGRLIHLTNSPGPWILRNNLVGLHFDYSGYGHIQDNVFSLGIVIDHPDDDGPHSPFQVTNNTVNNKPLIYWRDESKLTIPEGAGQIILIDCSDMTISDQDLSNSYGLILAKCSNIFVDNVLIQNDLINRELLPYGGHSDSNFGIFVATCSNTVIQNSYVENTCLGVRIVNSYNCTVQRNTFLGDGDGTGVTSQAGDIILNIEANLMANLSRGIQTWQTQEVIISENSISNCRSNGITVGTTSYGVIVGNQIENCGTWGLSLSFSDNINIYWNDFINNSAFAHLHESSFSTITFAFNYWSDWVNPDNDEDGVVDQKYRIEHSADYLYDSYPRISPTTSVPHHVLPPRIISPNGGEILEDTVLVSWLPAFDTHFHSITYSLFYSPDNGETWILIVSQLTGTSYSWDLSSMTAGSKYLIKLVTSCSADESIEELSDGTFTIIGNPPVTTTSEYSSVGVGVTIILLVLFLATLRVKIKREKFK